MAIHGLPTDSLRQLVHELRTPLNAILGFAEIIEQELFGAAGDVYRDMAGKIAVDARHLLVAFDDLDLAARVSRGEQGGVAQRIDPALMIAQVAARFCDSAGGCPVDIAMESELPPLCIDPVQGERMVQHLLRTVISIAPVGEAVTGSCWFHPDGGEGRVVLAIDRPSSLDGMEEAQLLDPGYTSDGDWADGPLLGLGFSLRLIRSLAGACGGSLDVEAERLLLSIPAVAAMEDAADIG
jgi:signal transduction histidine kinase